MTSILDFLKNLFSKIEKLFNKMQPLLKDAIQIGVTITEKLNTFVNSPEADIITALIPSTLDDAIKDKLRIALPKILAELKLVGNCANETDPDKIVACAIQALQQLDGDIKSAFLHNLSILIAQVAADGKLSWSDGVYVLEWYYQNKYKQ